MTENANPSFPFHNPELPLEQRVNDLVNRFTLEEKINLMCQYQDEIAHLGVKAYKHGTEAAHGMAWLGEATTFPQPIGLACTWDKTLLREIGSAIGDEARGFYHRNPAHNGLTLWAPTVDMERDPRWGRTEEAYGEDPILTGKLSAALTQGLQGDHPFYVKAVASLKHFIGNNNEIDRGECSVSLDPRNKHEYYLKAFEIPFKEGGALSMMTAYNSVNGVPANVNPDVNNIVKREWGMNGFVVSDAGDVLGTVNDHHYVETYKEAVALTIKAGVDSITDDHPISKQAIRDALTDGLLTENDLDTALRNTFRVRFRLGEFDPADRNPYAAIDDSAIMKPEHAKLALDAVRKSIVLLKNDGLLPLDANKLSKAAVIGPLAGIVYRDWYSGLMPYAITPFEGIRAKMNGEGQRVTLATGSNRVKLKSLKNDRYVTVASGEKNPLAASAQDSDSADLFETTDWGWDSHTIIAENNKLYLSTDEEQVTASSEHIWEWFTKEVFHVRPQQDENTVAFTTWNNRPVTVNAETGALEVQDGDPVTAERFAVEQETDGLQEAIAAARENEVAVVVVGNHPLINGKETIDRPDLTLAAYQEKLIREVYAVNPNTVVVVVGSYPFAMPWVQENIPAIVYLSHAGQELGRALADVLFGDYNPAGRVNMTWYESASQLGEFMDYDIIKSERTYQYFAGKPLYPFGHGLSYSRFQYETLRLEQSEDSITACFRVTNTSDVDGEEVVQLYTRALESRVKRPLRQLQSFERLTIAAGETQEVRFELDRSALAFWDVTRSQMCVEQGSYAFLVGASSGDIRLEGTLTVAGETIPPRDLTQVTAAVNYDDYSNIIIGENTEGGDSAATTSADAWLRYDDAQLGEETCFFEVRALSSNGAAVEIRLDAPDGPLAGSLKLEARPTWQTATGSVEPMAGNHNVYLVVQGEGETKLGWFRFGK
ncbi:glycoside hydrolase family 3 protein [Paenibacillus glycanilyticus]|uniref:Glucan 1,4-alpha-glucosidase n=1 Tax=Paenibacillus glycanilyticus TaxID=126569 RepID=A0ABQ6G8T1_9BACL|nr:glycoside hydrolase family 3 protein [Paenibacillus glycanilyticus]GLX66430.1 glucan 1,4-alpha-glucosidase [Paenibacillus glycanilyticus]